MSRPVLSPPRHRQLHGWVTPAAHASLFAAASARGVSGSALLDELLRGLSSAVSEVVRAVSEVVQPPPAPPRVPPAGQHAGRIEAAREQLSALSSELLAEVDRGARQRGSLADPEALVDYYEARLRLAQAEREPPERGDLATSEARAGIDPLLALLDPALSSRPGVGDELAAHLEDHPLDGSSPEALLGDLERLEDRALDRLRQEALDEASRRATVYRPDYYGVPQPVSRNEARLASEVRQIEQAEDRRRRATEAWRARRRACLRETAVPREVVAAAVTLGPQLSRYVDHCQEYVAAAGALLRRQAPLLGSASTSAWETHGGYTRRDVRDAERALRRQTPEPDT